MTRRTRRSLAVGLGLVLLAAAALLIARWDRVRNWYRPPTPDLPAADDIAGMRGQVWASGSRGYFETGVPEFDVPPALAPRIWRRLDGAEYVADPPVRKDLPLGELVVTTRQGGTVRVTFYESGSDRLVFTLDGDTYFQSEPRGDQGHALGGGLTLAATLRHVWGKDGLD